MVHFKLERLSVTELLQNPQQTIPSHPFREGNGRRQEGRGSEGMKGEGWEAGEEWEEMEARKEKGEKDKREKGKEGKGGDGEEMGRGLPFWVQTRSC